jgi:hypothetical protein
MPEVEGVLVMGFTKLDEGILRSSIMAEPPEVFKVWIAILASTDPDGVARVSSVFLSSVCYLALDIVDNSLAILEAPDPRSRSLIEDGRRIRRVDGGYLVINYGKYRDFTYSMNPDSVRKREYRKRVSVGHSGTCPGHSASASDIPSSEIPNIPNCVPAPQKYIPHDIAVEEYWRKKGARGSGKGGVS